MKKLIAAFAAALLVLGGAAAMAAIPDSDGTIHGCYLTSGNPNVRGALRVIDSEAGEACGSGETSLTWNQAGPAGVSGYEIVTSNAQLTLDESNGWTASATVACPVGKAALGGGAFANQSGFAFIAGSRPGASSWEVRYRDNPLGNASYTNTIQVTVYATCASV